MPTISEQLKEHLKNGADWEKMDTPVKGAFVVKVPKTKTRDAKLYLEIKPLNQYGSSLKRKGLFIGNTEILVSLAEAIADDKMYILTHILEDINKKAYSKLNDYDQKTVKIRDQLLDHLKNGEDWEKIDTPIGGVYIVKGPNTKFRQTKLYLEVKPVDQFGKPLKRSGLFISSKIELISLAEALLDDQSFQLIRTIDNVNKKKDHQIEDYNSIVLENEVQEIIEKEINPEKLVRISSKKIPKNVEKLYNDLMSIFNMDSEINGKLNVKNIIKKINKTLEFHGYKKEGLIENVKEQDESPTKRFETNELIYEFELKVRYFIKKQLEIIYGDNWWVQGVSPNIREIAEKRKRNKQRIEPKRTYDIIDFLNFNDYKSIISQTKNWYKIFSSFFREKYLIQSPLDKISNIRNDLAHHRFKDKDFEKCKTYIEDITKYLPDS